MKHVLQIYCKNNNISKEFPVGSTLLEIYQGLNLDFPYQVVSAKVNNRSEGLNFRVYNNKDVEFLDVRDPSGMRTYVRSLCFILYKAVRELFPQGKLYVEHPVSKGYFCNLRIGRPIELADVTAIKQRMQEIIAQDIPFHRTECHTTEAVRIFSEQGMNDKVKLLETSGSLYTYYYTLDDTIDYYYGNLLPSTGFIYLFDLVKYYDGLLLRIPNKTEPTKLDEMVKQEKMLDIFKEHLRWNHIMGLSNVGDFNRACQEGAATDLIKVAEALQEKKIAQIADEIYNRCRDNSPHGRLVLIAGPSSSGKTTFSKRLSVQLMTNGLRPYPISLDDYFVDREKTPRDANGNYDSDLGIEKLAKYASMFGLNEKSGVEIPESSPEISDQYAVQSAIGQGTNNYTVSQLNRYVAAVANRGTVYDLTLVDKTTDSSGKLIKEYEPEVVNTMDEVSSTTWDLVHEGMIRMVENSSTFTSLDMSIAGKTGTAQQSETSPDHALFVGFAPSDTPEIAIAVRIANGYNSSYPSEIGRDIVKIYFGLEDAEELVKGQAAELGQANAGD